MLARPRPKIVYPNKASTSGTKKCYDFRFQLQPAAATQVKNAVSALSDLQFNPSKSCLMGVGPAGFDITVGHIDVLEASEDSESSDLGLEESFLGYLCLCADKLDQFVCHRRMMRRVSVIDIFKFLDHAEDGDTVTIYVESETDLLSFDFYPATNTPLGPYTKSTKFLTDEQFGDKTFPDVTCGLYVTIPSPYFTAISTRMLKERDPEYQSAFISMKIKTGKVRTQVGNYYGIETTPEDVEAWWTWPYWNSMKKATLLANKCSLYLVATPAHNIMLKFRVGELGSFAFLKKEPQCFDKMLPALDFFGALN